MIDKILELESFSSLSDWRRAYTLGIVSKPIWMTISSQQMRASIIAKCFIDSIYNNKDSLARSDQRIKIAIIGGGIGGMTLAYCLHSYKHHDQRFKFDIDLFEKHDVLCPIQRGCATRKIHPNVQFWPSEYSDEFKVPYLKGKNIYESLSWQGNLNAGELASKVAEEYFSNFTTYNPLALGGNNALKIFQSTKYLKISKKQNAFEINYTANKIIDSIGNIKPSTKTNQAYEAIFFATGFGIENDYIDNNSKDDRKIISKPYWRNDNIGQPNLKDEPHRYLISGSGDGAVADVLRALIIDYNPEIILSNIKNTSINNLISKSYNRKTTISNINEKQIKAHFNNFFKKLSEAQVTNDNSTLDLFNELWNDNLNESSWTISSSPFELISEILIWPRIKENIEVICHFKDNDSISEIINNEKVTFYNKFLFFSVWAAGRIKTSKGNIHDISIKHQISTDNIIIRHGANYDSPILQSLEKELQIDYNNNKNKEENIYLENLEYRKGKYIFKIEETKPQHKPRRLRKISSYNKIKLKKFKIARNLRNLFAQTKSIKI